MIGNRDELDDIEKLFRALDTNKDGTLDVEELQNGLKVYMTDFKHSKINWVNFMSMLDTDQSGTIDFTEFRAAAQNILVALNKENLAKAFRMFD